MKMGIFKGIKGYSFWVSLFSVELIGLILFQSISPVSIMYIRENRILEDAEIRIMKLRRGTTTVDLGSAYADHSVTIRQLTHAFRFGCNAYQWNNFEDPALNAAYEQAFAALFNYATIPFYWNYFEYPYNVFRNNEYLNNLTAWLQENDIHIKGHPLIW